MSNWKILLNSSDRNLQKPTPQTLPENLYFSGLLANYVTLTAGLPVDEFIQTTLRFLNNQMNLRQASITLLEADGSGFRLHEINNKDDSDFITSDFLSAEISVLSEIIKTRNPQYRPNIAAADDNTLLDAGIYSDFMVPLWIENRCLGLLNVASNIIDGISEDVRRFLLLLASCLAQSLQNIHLIESLRESEQRYRNLIDDMHDIIQSVDSAGRFVYVNQAWLDLLGYHRQQLTSLTLWDVIHPSSQEHCQNIFKRIMSGEKIHHIEVTFCSKDGTEIPLEGSISARIVGNQVVASQGIFRDIRERKQTEKTIQAQIKYLNAIERISRISLQSSNINCMLEQVLDAMLDIFQCDRAWLLYPCDPDATTWNIPMERTRPQWPGANTEGTEIPMTQEAQEVFIAGLNVTGPIKNDPQARWLNDHIRKKFSIQSQLYMAIYPKVGKPWILGIHHCEKTHAFTSHEEQIFNEIGLRVADSLSTLLSFRDLSESEKKHRLLYETMQQGVLYQDQDAKIISANPAAERILGLPFQQMQGRNFFDPYWKIIHENGTSYPIDEHPTIIALNTGQPVSNIVMGIFHAKDNDYRWIMVNATPQFKSDSQPPYQVYVTFSDITKLKQVEKALRISESRLDYLAYHDPLTALPNRLLLNDRIEHALQRAHREKRQIAVFFLDLDRFKNVNDSLGHPVGDLLLKEVALRIKNVIRSEDTLARLGGDEFIILVEDFTKTKDLGNLADKLIKVFLNPFLVKDHELQLTLSLGISRYPKDGKDSATLIKNADAAMYQAKAEGRNNYQFYTSALTSIVFERLLLENALHQALRNNELILHYQPQYSVVSGKMISAEALIRWQHPKRGLLYPDKFIPLAEETGLIISIGEWVLHTACAQMKQWQLENLPIEYIAVNVSRQQCQRSEFVDTVKEALQASEINPRHLELEITESIIMQQLEKGINILDELKVLGVSIGIDDFGTGYSSLSYLKQLPVHKLKIDRSFVNDVTQDQNDAAITRAIIALAQNLQLTVLAEGVETEKQLEFLRQQGCDEAQGYLYSLPVSPEQFRELLYTQANLL